MLQRRLDLYRRPAPKTSFSKSNVNEAGDESLQDNLVNPIESRD